MRTLAQLKSCLVVVGDCLSSLSDAARAKMLRPVAKTDATKTDAAKPMRRRQPMPAPKSDKPFQLGESNRDIHSAVAGGAGQNGPMGRPTRVQRHGRAAQSSKKPPARRPSPSTKHSHFATIPASTDANEKILKTLGRLAPADGAGVNYDATFVRHAGGDLKSTNPVFISSQY